MIKFLTITLLSITLSSLCLAGEPIPPKIAKLIKLIPSIEKGETRISVFKRFGLKDDKHVKLIVGGTSVLGTEILYNLTEDGLWVLVLKSNNFINGEYCKPEKEILSGFIIYRITKKNPTKYFGEESHKMYPYYIEEKVIPNKKTKAPDFEAVDYPH